MPYAVRSATVRTSPKPRTDGPVPRNPARSPDPPSSGPPTARTSLPGDARAPSAARRFVRGVLAGWNAHAAVTDDATLLVSELVTNAVVHAGTSVDLECRLDPARGGSLVVEVTDHHPAREFRARPRQGCGDRADAPAHGGQGLRLVAELAETWGTAYRRTDKTVWFHLPTSPRDPTGPSYAVDHTLLGDLRVAEILAPGTPCEPPARGLGDSGPHRALSFLAEASELLSGQFDEDTVASLATQLAVPRLADWCAVWLDAESTPGDLRPAPRLSRVWHAHESCVEPLRLALQRTPPALAPAGRAVPWPHAPAGPSDGPSSDGPSDGPAGGPAGGSALACRLVAGGRGVGTLLLGRSGPTAMSGDVVTLTEDFARRLALALASARKYTRQATISRILQRGLLPRRVAEIPGLDKAVVYEPRGDTAAGGDFYDVFAAGRDRWCFALGDVCGSGPEAAVTTGLVRPWLRLLGKEGYGVGDVLTRLNRMLGEEAAEAENGAGPRFLSLLYGELVPHREGVRCTLASAGHPLPLLLRPDGSVRSVAAPQMLLGVVDDVAYVSQSFDLAHGDTLLCVTDGVTERKAGNRLFDDGDGLATALAGCAGLTAEGVAGRIRRAVHGFAPTPPDDDLALLVLRAE
ncbi:protein phosphatase [Streptomyces luteoverticillatus]|uniref:Protein phosphatase n=1 Tax=Streptomyces luteoverticillatus TaxID=66425 RepID=A0A3Q9FXT5_STRLT|nr:protein phosphatase [Streptomyces luteoverticillatus]